MYTVVTACSRIRSVSLACFPVFLFFIHSIFSIIFCVFLEVHRLLYFIIHCFTYVLFFTHFPFLFFLFSSLLYPFLPQSPIPFFFLFSAHLHKGFAFASIILSCKTREIKHLKICLIMTGILTPFFLPSFLPLLLLLLVFHVHHLFLISLSVR